MSADHSKSGHRKRVSATWYFVTALFQRRVRTGVARDRLNQGSAFRVTLRRVLGLILFLVLWRWIDATFVLHWIFSALIAYVATLFVGRVLMRLTGFEE